MPAAVPSGARALLPHVAVCLAGAAAYANTFSVPFVLDDQSSIVAAGDVHAMDLTPGALAHAAHAFPAGRWLAVTSFAVNHALGGLDPAGYHAVNLFFHLASAIIVLLLAREVFARAGGLPGPARGRAAVVTALLFVAHPVQTQAVTYVVQRMTSMGAFFGFAALLLYVRARAAPRAPTRLLLLALALASAVLAFSCKETFALLPLLALLLEALLFPGLAARVRANRGLVAGGAVLLVAVAILLLRAYGDALAAEEHARHGVGLGERLLTQPRVLWQYVSLIALPLPSRLHVYYAWIPSHGLLEPATTLPALLALLALAAAAWLLRRRVPLLTFAVTWFIGALLIEQTVLPLHFAFEHRLYVAGLGWLLLAAWALERAAAGRPGLSPWVVAAPAVALLAAGTFARNRTWNDRIALFSDPAGYGPGDAGNLLTIGNELRRRGSLDEAEASLRHAMALEPGNPSLMVTLGVIVAQGGRLDEAIRTFERALALDPEHDRAWYNLSGALLETNRLDEAERAARRGLAVAPSSPGLHFALSLCRQRRGDLDAARREAEEALRLDPAFGPASHVLGRLQGSGDALRR